MKFCGFSRRYGGGRKRWLSLAAIPAIAFVLATAASGTAAATTSCHPTGNVVGRHAGVVLWSVTTHHGSSYRDFLYICAPPKGGARVVISQKTTASFPTASYQASRIKLNGHFVGFYLTENVELQQTLLVVFNTQTGHRELEDYGGCEGNDECPTFPTIANYELAKDGWVAEVFNGYNQSLPNTSANVYGLVATNGGKHHYALDVGYRFSHLSISGNTFKWTGDLGGASSVKLSKALVLPKSAPARAVCSLLSSQDVAPVLGAGASGQIEDGQCVYTSQSNPSERLTVGLLSGLTPSQIATATSHLDAADFGDFSYPTDEDPQLYITSTTQSGVTTEQLVGLGSGAQLTFNLTSPGTNADEQLAHLSNVAFDRVFAVPVKRTR